MLARLFSSWLVCSEPFLPSSLGYGVFPLFSRVGFSLSVDVGYQGLVLVGSNITSVGVGVV